LGARKGLIGDWDKTGIFLENFHINLRKNAADVIRQVAQIVYTEILEIISSGGEGQWPPLTEDYVDRKGHNRFYELTGTLLSDIEIEETKKTSLASKIVSLFSGEQIASIYIGITKETHAPSEMSYDELLEILEDKYDRPIFSMAFERARPKIQPLLKTIGQDLL
jgi:hypothetical protein